MAQRRPFVIGTSHQTAPLNVLERCAIEPDRLGDFHEMLRPLIAEGEFVVLSTCNRTEIYGAHEDPLPVIVSLRNLLLQVFNEKSGNGESIEESHFYSHLEQDAVRHLFTVVSGLDSLILGETEITGQAQRSFEFAVGRKTVQSLFTQLFSAAFRTGKRVRTETAIGEGSTSVASAAVHLAERVVGELSRRTVLVIGAGETGALVSTYLKERGSRILIANRTEDRAKQLAVQKGAEPVPISEIAAHMATVDVVICATASPEPLVTVEMVTQVQRNRKGRMLLFVDISLPHNVSPGVAEVSNVLLKNMNDLKAIVSQNLARRSEQLPLAKGIIEEEIRAFREYRQTLTVGPLIRDLRQSFEDIRLSEIAEHAADLSDAERERLDRITRSMVNRMLHLPTVSIRDLARKSEEDPHRMRWLKDLFGLK